MYYHQPTVATYPTYPFHHQQPFHQLPRPHYQSYMYPNSYPNYDENQIMSSSNMRTPNSSTTKRSRREYENDGGDDDDEEMQDQDVIKQEAKRVRTEGTQIHESSNNVGNGGDGWMNHGVNSNNNNNARNSLFESVSQNSNTSNNNNNLLNSFQIQQHEYQRKRQYRYQQQQAQEMQQLQHELSNQQQELRSSRSDVVYKNINTILHDLHVQKRHRKKSKPTSNIV